jgi:hypothetical protein
VQRESTDKPVAAVPEAALIVECQEPVARALRIPEVLAEVERFSMAWVVTDHPMEVPVEPVPLRAVEAPTEVPVILVVLAPSQDTPVLPEREGF